MHGQALIAHESLRPPLIERAPNRGVKPRAVDSSILMQQTPVEKLLYNGPRLFALHFGPFLGRAPRLARPITNSVWL